MMYLRQIKRFGILTAATLAVALSAPASAEVRQVDGHLWLNSTTEQKQAYLIGITNTLAVYHALQVKKGNVDESSPMSRYYRATEGWTIEMIQDRLDKWFDANPSRRDAPVLGVVWLGLVKASN